MMAPASIASVVLVALGTVGCAAIQPGDGGATDPDGPLPSVSIRMGPDGPELPDEVAALQAYGSEHAAEFGGLYIDDQSQGTIVMLFTDNLEQHEAAVIEIWPRVTVQGVRFSEAQLRALQDRLGRELFGADGIELLSTSVDIYANQVQVALKADDPDMEARLEAAHPGMLDASVYPPAGPWANVETGPGWRLLAVGDTRAEAYTVRAAVDASEWAALWATLGLKGDLPAVDLETEVVVSFGHGQSQSCPELRLDEVRIEDGVVFSVTSDPIAPRGCNLDLSAAAVFVVAIDRSALPGAGFRLQLDDTGSPGCTEECGFTPVLDVELGEGP